ncbi:hypothetical protein NP493_37g00003 [Ridgeia piscesae]|uniref:Uncharacterized protein n=1 Tax=Ridgeia piscesae TaxID=27915 RepID=A0AAD9UK23_RIDPI|nr:hypothetical protein NP493_37g00003 [Ridgeia piscesae]
MYQRYRDIATKENTPDYPSVLLLQIYHVDGLKLSLFKTRTTSTTGHVDNAKRPSVSLRLCT